MALDVYVHTTLWILCVQSIYDAQAALSEFHIYKRRGVDDGGGVSERVGALKYLNSTTLNNLLMVTTYTPYTPAVAL